MLHSTAKENYIILHRTR